ncbi:uncharacterized protein EV420DRAFT_1566351 [Desarmillaria tabescens]|uniref:Actin-like ATPase domain-containing protein n=1 Tax=Armillaria tabescens TaxID=1929756 RepID=A0AA39MWN5_ARMTA|nr:uncharacterized protein EV420DRAFT_1566351 [Desarmillaria tabescens]KAK0448953.1 hypothetical protein EV420DRAFT_1566351 [Desarmillaria tabescens]
MITRKPYAGSRRKLVFSFDLGTTFSGISYSILDPGSVPEIKGVTRFPEQERVGSDAKIPTILYYDKTGTVRAVGAEALRESILEQAEEESWFKCSGFKLHLRSNLDRYYRSAISTQATDFPPLPPDKDAVSVFADFFKYLFECAKTYILETHPSATIFWSSVEDSIEFILSHPNNWEGRDQANMRRAALPGEERVHFVTEGEASLHFCIHHGLSSFITDQEAVIIIDAGGGTVDISTYTCVSAKDGTQAHTFKEVAAPQCNFAGSMFVTRRAKAFFDAKLKRTKFAKETEYIAQCFDKKTKLRFKAADEPAYIHFGSMRDKDPKLNINMGRLKLTGAEVASFFEPSVSSIIKAVDEQRFASKSTVSAAFLVGGFAASDWLFSKLQEHFKSLNIAFSRPDSHVNKAVADGALSFHLDRAVLERLSKYNYGIRTSIAYDASIPGHVDRKNKTFMSEAGVLSLGNQYNIILPKGESIAETKEFRRPYVRNQHKLSDFASISQDILCYSGTRENPLWMDAEPDKYPVLCNVVADTREAARSLVLQRRPDGKSYFSFKYSIILLLGQTEMKAQIAWDENVGVVTSGMRGWRC